MVSADEKKLARHVARIPSDSLAVKSFLVSSGRVCTLAFALLGAAACGQAPDDPTESIASVEQAITAGRYSVKSISTISYAPNSFVIGNVYPGWTDDLTGTAVFRNGPGNPNGHPRAGSEG